MSATANERLAALVDAVERATRRARDADFEYGEATMGTEENDDALDEAEEASAALRERFSALRVHLGLPDMESAVDDD